MNGAEVEAIPGDVEGQPDLFFITDVLHHGNSGGPVMDVSGNIIGIVVAKNVLYTVNKITRERVDEQHVGVAVNLAALKRFLFSNGVVTQSATSGLVTYAGSAMKEYARNYTVSVRCRLPPSVQACPVNPAQMP